ncbi:MAG TPA: hypothetical protein VGI23_01455 [Steroidobacteraceae bacterium]
MGVTAGGPVPLDRRSFVTLGSLSLATPVADAALGSPAPRASIKAVAFDAFAIFDPRPIFQSCEAAFPGRGSELANAWRVRQFEYQWLRALTVWNNRQNAAAEELSVRADATGTTLTQLVSFLHAD